MKKRRMIRNKKAAGGILVSIVILISVMFAVIVGSVIFFAFGESAHTAQTHIETDSATNSTNASISLAYNPASGSVTVESYNSGTTNWTVVSSALVTVSDRTVSVDTRTYDANLTQLRTTYNDLGYSTTTSVITYAIIVFAMAALVPLVIVGGLMLKSLGFFGGGGKV